MFRTPGPAQPSMMMSQAAQELEMVTTLFNKYDPSYHI